MPVTLSPFASLRVNSAKGLARRAQRSFASLRMTARTPLQSASGKPSLQTSDGNSTSMRVRLAMGDCWRIRRATARVPTPPHSTPALTKIRRDFASSILAGASPATTFVLPTNSYTIDVAYSREAWHPKYYERRVCQASLRNSIVPRTGFEPVIFALKGRCPRPLDERGSCNAALLLR